VTVLARGWGLRVVANFGPTLVEIVFVVFVGGEVG
jgi:hypothetical protein